MSVLGNPLLLGPEGYQISRSVRLRSSASAYFNRTLGAGSGTTSTLSVWLKRGTLSTTQAIMSVSPDATNDCTLFIGGANDLTFSSWSGGGRPLGILITNQVFRDPSAWYHIVMVVDTTNATASNRLRMYINGVQVTAFSTATYPTQNNTWYWNQAYSHRIGRYPDAGGGGNYFDGYLTEVNFIDGQALTPSSFGETDAVTGVWKPKKYAGTYGTNGFYLNFSDNSAATAAAIGKDNSGNGNNWTPNNISVTAGVTYDSMIDVPTLYADGGNGRGNYAVLNPLQSAVAPTAGNLDFSSGGGETCPKATIQLPLTGKWYWETYCSQTGTDNYIGVTTNQTGLSFSGTYRGYRKTGVKDTNGTTSAYGATWASGDTLAVAVDMDAGTIVFYKNGTSQGTAFSDLAGTAWTVFFYGYINAGHQVNFGQRPFAYTPPTGFKALNTQNLPEPTIKKGNEYFDVALVTGSATVPQTITVNFAPNFLWSKCRNSAVDHGLYDTVRGGNQILSSNTTGSEVTTTGNIVTFNSNGATLQAGGSFINDASRTYVDWMWKESASAGFGIVTYTGTGANRTVAHSLGVAPSMIIFKRRNSTSNWPVYHVSNGNTSGVYLNGTNAKNTSVDFWNNTSPTSTVFTLGAANEVNVNTSTNVAYCFSEVAGFSKFGSYTGNGSADGPFVFCGFRPRFVMVKRTDSTGSWYLRDTARNAGNVADLQLYPDLANAEATEVGTDFLSSGFKIRGTSVGFNANGGTYIFAAFAEHPFKNSLAR